MDNLILIARRADYWPRDTRTILSSSIRVARIPRATSSGGGTPAQSSTMVTLLLPIMCCMVVLAWLLLYWILRVAAKGRRTSTSSDATSGFDPPDRSTMSAEERGRRAEDRAMRLKERRAQLDRAAPPKRLAEWKAGMLHHNCLTPASLTGNMICAICLDPMGELDMVRGLPCSHVYHASCIQLWFEKKHETCPLCKRSINVVDSAEDRQVENELQSRESLDVAAANQV